MYTACTDGHVIYIKLCRSVHVSPGRGRMVATPLSNPLALLLQLLLLRRAIGDQVEISLNGDSWSLSDTNGRVKAIKAQVPGSVHLDLM